MEPSMFGLFDISGCNLLAIGIMDARIWWSLPLILVVSLVYGATRHERLPQILSQSWKSVFQITVFMAIIFAIIWAAGFWN